MYTGRDFSEGMAIVSKEYNRFDAIRGFIDKNNKLIMCFLTEGLMCKATFPAQYHLYYKHTLATEI